MKNHSIRHLTIAALLIGMGIVIPMVMPKIVIGPASFTLASHVPVFVAMFFSPAMAIAVALGTTFWLFLNTATNHCFTGIVPCCFCRHRCLLFTEAPRYFTEKWQTLFIEYQISEL